MSYNGHLLMPEAPVVPVAAAPEMACRSHVLDQEGEKAAGSCGEWDRISKRFASSFFWTRFRSLGKGF